MFRSRVSPGAEAALLVLPLLALPLLLFGLSERGERFQYPEPPLRTLQLVIASPQWEGIKVELEWGFRRWLYERERLGVELRWIDVGGGAQTLRWIEERFSRQPDGIGVDIFFGGGTDPYDSLKEQRLLQRYEPPAEILDGVARQVGGFLILDPDRTWFGTALTGFGIMVNQEVLRWVKPLSDVKLRTFEDLADPRLEGWVGAADPRSSSSSHTFYEILLQAYGFDRGLRLARLIGANLRAYSKFSAELPELVAVGQVACAPSIDHYARAQIDKVGPAIRFVMPEGNTLVNADAVAILKGASNLEAARRFIDFLLSDAAGRLWMLALGEPGGPARHPLNRASVRPGLYEQVAGRSSVRNNPFAMRFAFQYDNSRASARWTLLNDLLGALVVDTHQELKQAVKAWRGLDGDRRMRAEAVLFENPMSESELLELAAGRWRTDAALAEQMKLEWQRFARQRYAAVIDLARQEHPK